MYYPVQIPYILESKFRKNVLYTETTDVKYQDFVICFWEMQPATIPNETVDNIIIPDGCIYLIVDYSGRQIGYSGMSKTEFHFKIVANSKTFGARLKPGAFHQLTGLPATVAMDTFIPLDSIDTHFNSEGFFSMSYLEQKLYFDQYLHSIISKTNIATDFILLFEKLYNKIPANATQLYDEFRYSPKQCQRLCFKHFGLSPKMILNVMRFQKCLSLLTSKDLKQSDIVSILGYYDQPHLIKDIKNNIGITPLELFRALKNDEFIQ